MKNVKLSNHDLFPPLYKTAFSLITSDRFVGDPLDSYSDLWLRRTGSDLYTYV